MKALAGPLLAVLALAGLEVVARAVLVLFPAIGDPWSGGAAAPLNGDFVRQMEVDAGVVPERQRLYVRDRTPLMADPIHPNAIGHHVLADALAPLVCPATR